VSEPPAVPVVALPAEAVVPPAAESPVAEWPRPQAAAGPRYWLLSLFAPAPSDAVDWGHGSYTIMERGGRVESPARSGELKKQLRMVAEGSVVCAAAEPRGSAPDVAPDGFPHPVFRAGFAVAIRLPEVN
jgi:CRISPR/Cas system CSM-associated protein Csm4 (group 5 of RAMP superfamily)